MADQEELKLVVSLDDQASAKLEPLKKQIVALNDSRAAASYEGLKKSNVELGEVVKIATKGFDGLTEASTLAARSLHLTASGVLAVGAVVGTEIKALSDYVQAYQHLGQAAKITGIDPGQFKEMRETFERAGVGAAVAEKNIAGIAQSMAEIGKRESPLRQGLLAGLHGADLAQMQAGVSRLMGAAATGNAALFGNTLKQLGDQVYAGNLARYGSAERAAAARTSFLARFHTDELSLIQEQFEQLSDEQLAVQARRVAAANELNKVVVEIKQNFNEVGDKFQTEVLPIITQELQPISDALSDWSDDLDSEDLKKFSDTLKEIVDSLRAVGLMFREVGAYLNLANTAGPRLRKVAHLSITPEQQKQIDASDAALAAIEAEKQKRDKEAGIEPGKPRDLAQELLFGKQVIHGPPYDPAQALKEKEDADARAGRPRSLLWRAPEPPPPPAPQPPIVAVPQPPPVVAAPPPARAEPEPPPPAPEPPRLAPEHGRIWNLLHPPRRAAAEAGMPQPLLEAEQPTPRIATPDYSGAAEQAEQHRQAIEAIKKAQIPDIGRALPEPPPKPAEPPLGGWQEFRRDAPQSTNIEDRRGGVYAPDVPIKPVGTDKQWVESIGMLTTLVGGPLGFLGAAYRGLKFGQAGGIPNPLSPEPLAQQGGSAQPRQLQPIVYRRPELDEPSPAAQVAERWPNIDRAELYRGGMQGETTHRVQGNAKLTVDVTAPPGTSVDATGDDFFTPTEINRQIAMERSASSTRRPGVYGPR